MTLVGSDVFGTTRGGGVGFGTVFSTHGGYHALTNFTTAFQLGYDPRSPLLAIGSVLYGTTSAGGQNGGGTLYSINTNGSNFQQIFSFPKNLGGGPVGTLALVGSTLYGVTGAASSGNLGTIFSMHLDGTDFQIMHAFNGLDGYINGLTAWETAGGLTLLNNRLYGTTPSFNQSNAGEVFSIRLDGGDFRIEHLFDPTLREGYNPQGDLLLIGNTIYGTTLSGGQTGGGTIFALDVPEPASIVLSAVSAISMIVCAAHSRRRASKSSAPCDRLRNGNKVEV